MAGIALGLGIASLALTAGTTTASFIQAGKQKKLGEDAQTKADDAMKDARSALDVNYFEDLAINKEAYELERDATLQAEAGALQALQESGQRGVAGGVGRLALAGQKQQASTRTAMAKELGDLEKLTAQEDSRLRDLGVQLDLEEVAGAQQAAAQAQEMRAAKVSEGIQGVASAAQQGLSMVPLYGQNQTAQRAAIGTMAGTDEGLATLKNVFDPGAVANAMSTGNPFSTQDFYKNMSAKQYRGFKKGMSKTQRQNLYFGTDYTNAYQDPNQAINF
tara:strand:- start:16322 stop:17149 length:828 start_codon:yes stop_codon:yes gene_type:complete